MDPVLSMFLACVYPFPEALAPSVKVFHSVRAIFYTPSNPSTTTGMYRETIQATPSWN